MGLITILYAVHNGSPASVHMREATPQNIMQRILIVRRGIEDFEDAILRPKPKQRKITEIKELLEEFKEEIDELYDYYCACVRKSRQTP